MNEGHKIILNFLHFLQRMKGEKGEVFLAVCYQGKQSAQRGAFGSRGFSNGSEFLAKGFSSGSEFWQGCNPEAVVAPKESPGDANSVQQPPDDCDGILRVGEYVQFMGHSPISGYVHLFNLGTSGDVQKLAPSQQFPENQVLAGDDFFLPSEKLLSGNLLPESAFTVSWPTDKENINPERLLVIVTRNDIVLQVADLDARLNNREGCGDVLTRCASRGAGFGGAVEKGMAKLFSLPENEWEYGILEMEVKL